MQKMTFIVRSMQPQDMGSAIKLSNAEGWNQTENDWKLFLESRGNVCMVAECDNKVIGTTTAINYSNNVAWIGMVLVDKNYRGLGVSKALLTNILKKLETFKSVKLDATPLGQQVYKKLEFKDDYQIARMTTSRMHDLSSDDINDVVSESIKEKHIAEIIALDEVTFGANRAQLIKYLAREYPGNAMLLKRNDRIIGFVFGRDGNKYHQVGPVVASSPADAKILVAKALKKLVDQPVVVDVPRDKEALLAWLSSIGFTKQRYFIRMYKKENPLPGITSNQYLICGPEFG